MPAAASPLASRFSMPERTSQDLRGPRAVALMVALGLHGVVIFCWPAASLVIERAEFGVETADSSVEVSLVAALPAEEVASAVPPEPPAINALPPEVMPAPPEPLPIPAKPPEMTVPEPEAAPPPTPRPLAPPKQKPRAAEPKPARMARASGDGSSPSPGHDATTARASGGAQGAKPGYLRNPHPAYPEAARTAGQQGIVQLYVQVDAAGRVSAVRISRSSGFALLDERARSTVASRWTFKPARAGGVPVASSVIIPIRFTLNR